MRLNALVIYAQYETINLFVVNWDWRDARYLIRYVNHPKDTDKTGSVFSKTTGLGSSLLWLIDPMSLESKGCPVWRNDMIVNLWEHVLLPEDFMDMQIFRQDLRLIRGLMTPRTIQTCWSSENHQPESCWHMEESATGFVLRIESVEDYELLVNFRRAGWDQAWKPTEPCSY